MEYILERIDLTRDIHFHTHTTIDTLDYSGTGLNSGSKVVLAAYGEVKRTLCKEVPAILKDLRIFRKASLAMPGVVILEAAKFESYELAQVEMEVLNQQLAYQLEQLSGVAMIVVADDAPFTAQNIRNYVWVTYTRCNPSHDMYGIDSFTENKHWGCRGPLVIDARIKPHHAPPLEKEPLVEKRIDKLFEKGGSLQGIIKN